MEFTNMILTADYTNHLINEIYELDSENFTNGWKGQVRRVIGKSVNYEYSYIDHSDNWLSILSKIAEWSSLSELFLGCWKLAVITMPLIFKEPRMQWMNILQMLHEKVLKEEISYEEAQPFFQVAEKKFGLSYFKAPYFWSSVRSFEQKFAEKNNYSQEDTNRKIIEIYNKQFSRPYQGMQEEWEKFKGIIKKFNFTSDQKIEIQELFYANSEEAEQILTEYPDNLEENERLHHLKFEFWVDNLLNKSPPSVDLVDILCEESIFNDPDSFCFYHVYVKVLASEAFSVDPNREHKLFSIVKRALTYGRSGCSNANGRFIEHALIVSADILNYEMFSELVDRTMRSVSVFSCQSTWFYSRRAIINATKNKILSEGRDVSELKKVFERTIEPMTLEFFKNNTLPEETKYLSGIDKILLELFKVWIHGEKAIRQLSYPLMFGIWREYLDSNPLVLLAYGDLVRSYGTYEEAEDAYKYALGELQTINDSENTSFLTRKCHLQLLSNYLELQMTNGSATNQASLSRELSKLQSLFTQTYNELYDTASGVNGISFDTLNISGVNSSQTEEPIARQLRSLNVESCDSQTTSSKYASEDQSTSSVTSKNMSTGYSSNIKDLDNTSKTGYPLFISNLSFIADENDIKKAFNEKGISVNGIELKRLHGKRQHLGYGTLYLESQDQIKQAIDTLDRIIIQGRPAYLSLHRGNKPRSQYQAFTNSRNKLPNVLHLSGIPDSWRNPKTIENAFIRYGHIRSISVNDKQEPITAKVEFFMPEDANVLYNKVKEGDEFKHFGITVRKCFPSKAKGNVNPPKGITSHMQMDVDELRHSTRTKRAFEAPLDIGLPSKRKFILQKGGPKSRMKKKLNVPSLSLHPIQPELNLEELVIRPSGSDQQQVTSEPDFQQEVKSEPDLQQAVTSEPDLSLSSLNSESL